MIPKNNYPLPLIEDQIALLRGKTYFSTFDLKNGFFHIKMAEDSIPYTVFTTPFGIYEYNRMPFRLKGGLKGDVVVYMDDLLVATRTVEDHIHILKKLLRILAENLLVLRIDKCNLSCTSITFLGYVITEEGVAPNHAGVDAIRNYPVLQDVKSLQRFLGMTSYFRKFIKDFSLLTRPLYNLVRKGVEFKFGRKEMESFEILKRKLIEAPALSIYDPQDEIELYTDASSSGFGATLMQRKKDLKFQPTFYFSKSTSDTESLLHSFEIETLAIIYALRRFRIYLQGGHFEIVTDCTALKMTLEKKDVCPRIQRWALELLHYDYETEHSRGTQMQHVDALSRCTNILILEENPFELNLAICQNKDENIIEIREKLEKSENELFEMRNGLIYRKKIVNCYFMYPKKWKSKFRRETMMNWDIWG
uniref:RNA-directed DNA polymerase n=1 Tax=Bracon brevicornis TaxID=1563983 RepID=A0A6V7JG98_9HYME